MNMQSNPHESLAGTVAALLVVFAVAAASAQDRSDTGRHRPVPPVTAGEDSLTRPPVLAPDQLERHWYLGVCGGLQGGSDLFRVEVVNGVGVPWNSGTGSGFQSSRFTAALDRNAAFGLFLARDLGNTWLFRADFGYSRMDVAAEALIGQTGAVFLFDRMDVLNFGLGAEARLTRASSYPFAEVSVMVSHLGPARAKDLEQTNFGGRLGLGYLHNFQKVWGLRLEARLSATGFSVGDYVPQSSQVDQPVIEYESPNHLIFFEFLIGIQAKI